MSKDSTLLQLLKHNFGSSLQRQAYSRVVNRRTNFVHRETFWTKKTAIRAWFIFKPGQHITRQNPSRLDVFVTLALYLFQPM